MRLFDVLQSLFKCLSYYAFFSFSFYTEVLKLVITQSIAVVDYIIRIVFAYDQGGV